MIKYVLILMVAAVAFGVYKMKNTKLPFMSKAPAAAVPAEVKAEAKKEGLVAYDVRVETLHTRSGGYLATDAGEYEVGRLSIDGWVRAIDRNIVIIDQANKRRLYVLAQRSKLIDTNHKGVVTATK